MSSHSTGFANWFVSYRAMRGLLLATYALLAAPLFLGYVVSPFNNRPEIGDPGPAEDQYHSNRALADHAHSYIAALSDQLENQDEGWLNTWNPHIECGMAQLSLGGASKTYLPTHVLSFFFHDPYKLYSWLALLTLGLMGFFAFGLAEELGLRPAACYVSAVTFSLGPFSMFWLTHLGHLSTFCWTMGILWLVTAYARRGEAGRLAAIAFCVHSLLITGYPVLIVLFAYLVVPYTLAVIITYERTPLRIFKSLAGVGAAAVLGVAASLPVLLDILHAARESARLGRMEDSFYLDVFPKFENAKSVFLFIAMTLDPYALGGPAKMDHVPVANSVLLLPLTSLLLGIAAVMALLPRNCGLTWRPSMRCLLLVIVVLYLFNTSATAHLFAVRHLGLGMSRCRTCWAALFPICILTGMVVDHVLTSGPSRRAWLGYFVSVVGLALLYIALERSGTFVFWAAIFGAGMIAILLALFLATRSPALIVALTFGVAMVYGSTTAMVRPRTTICLRSALTDALGETRDGSCRYARVRPMDAALQPNEDCVVKLSSVHAYDSLSSRRYQEVVKSWSSSETLAHGRYFGELDPGSMANSGEALSLAGVKYFVSKAAFSLPWAELTERVDNSFVYRSLLAPRMLFQTSAFTRIDDKAAALAADSRQYDQPVECRTRQNDHLLYATAPLDHESLLFISQQYHGYWQATDSRATLKTVVVNGFYQGVILPPGTARIELHFRPWGRWAWIPQAVFLAMGLLFLVQWSLTAGKLR